MAKLAIKIGCLPKLVDLHCTVQNNARYVASAEFSMPWSFCIVFYTWACWLDLMLMPGLILWQAALQMC